MTFVRYYDHKFIEEEVKKMKKLGKKAKVHEIACLRIVLRHVPVLQLHVHVQAQVMIRLETIFREM